MIMKTVMKHVIWNDGCDYDNDYTSYLLEYNEDEN